MRLTLFPETSYRLSLFPIIGKEANAIIDDEGFDVDVFERLEENYVEETERIYDIILDFYTSEDGTQYAIDESDEEYLDDNALEIYRSKFEMEEDEIEPDDDFMLIEDLQRADNCDGSNHIEVFKDIMTIHNITTDDEQCDIIVDAIRRRMKQVAKQLVDEGLAEDEESVKFALQYGPTWGCRYHFDIDAEEFDLDALRVIDCCDWNDCGDISEVLYDHWPDRLVGNVVYHGKFYAGECDQIDSFDFNIDLVDCNLNSIL